MGELEMLRAAVVRAHGLTMPNTHVQSPAVMIARAHKALDDAVKSSPAIMGFLGYGGPEERRDIIDGDGDIS